MALDATLPQKRPQTLCGMTRQVIENRQILLKSDKCYFFNLLFNLLISIQICLFGDCSIVGIDIAVTVFMPRLPRSFFPVSGYYHVICRGNNHSVLFKENSDFMTFIRIVRKFKDEWPFNILHHCIMPTHVHFLIEVENLKYLSKAIQSIELSYFRYFTRKHNYTGHLWHGRFRAIPITSEAYLFACGRYIELNAVSAGISSTPENYEWCSYGYYALGKDDLLVTPAEWFMGLSNHPLERKEIYKNFIYEKIDCGGEEESNIFEQTLLIGDVSAVNVDRACFCGKKVRRPACDNDLPQKRPQRLCEDEC